MAICCQIRSPYWKDGKSISPHCSTAKFHLRQLEDAAAEASVDDSISTAPPSLLEVYGAIKKTKSGKSLAMKLLMELFGQVWESETVRQGITIPIYKGTGSRSDCKNYRGITLL